ncbi:hypothetical protein M5K25_022644 [Dendrobium thyrsiflorum]|uniref:Uncharacterized protein n=1 Tax=Dendrobium thyrsiflorum TaxID=117978 RepID=A0ABD0U6J1_DENTH
MAKPLGPTGEFFKRRDEWRKHPMLVNQFRHATPGLGIALIAFGVYLVGIPERTSDVLELLLNLFLSESLVWRKL